VRSLALALALSLSVVALAGCAHDPDLNALDGLSWGLTHTESEGDKLVFGAPGTDDVDLMLTCLPRSGQVKVFLAGPLAPFGRARVTFDLQSGGAKATVHGTQDNDMEDVFEAPLAADDPAMAGFGRTGELTVAIGHRPTALPPAGAMARTFVESCRR